MGWLEILALLKRVLPLLSRVAPMLETYLAARGATQGEADALDRISADLKAHLAATSEHQGDLKDLLEQHGERLERLSSDLRQLHSENNEHSVRLDYLEQHIASTSRLARIAGGVIVALLLICTGLLVALLLRH